MHSRFLNSSFFVIAGLLAAESRDAFAQLNGDTRDERRYAVEIILFTYDDSVSAGTEVFIPPAPVGPGTPAAMPETAYEGAIGPDGEPFFGDNLSRQPDRLATEAENGDDAEAPPSDMPLEEIVVGTAGVGFSVLPPEALTLDAMHEKLLLLDAYQPVLWSGWTQVVREESVSPAIDMRRLGNLPLSFDGELTLYLGRFVHLVVDLSLEERRLGALPDRSGDAYAGPPPVYRIREDRIMRNGELRYFDHPHFGLIARLSLLESAGPADPALDDPLYEPPLMPDSGPSSVPGPGSGAQ